MRGWFVEPRDGRKARAWLWVAVSAAATVFRIARSRGAQVTKEMLGEDFGGFLAGDRWSAYRWRPRGIRQICWAHLIRDFRGFVERGGQSAGSARSSSPRPCSCSAGGTASGRAPSPKPRSSAG